jgi:NADH:ubiquinone oxidoreductase subunit E
VKINNYIQKGGMILKTVRVCIGSSCHIKGSYDVMEIFKNLIKENGLEEDIEIGGVFCLGNCTKGVSVQRWDGNILSVSKENAREIFINDIVSKL